jgi:hypothetical protein
LPQELAIILVVIVGAIWLLAKIGQGISNFIDQSSKSYDQATAKRREKRFSKGRKDVGQYIHISIPDELDSLESKFELARKEFEQARALTNWVARPIPWTKKKFQTVTLPAKHEFYADMRIDDIVDILTPNSESAMWSYEESQIVNHQCKYPFPAPSARVVVLFEEERQVDAVKMIKPNFTQDIFKIAYRCNSYFIFHSRLSLSDG